MSLNGVDFTALAGFTAGDFTFLAQEFLREYFPIIGTIGLGTMLTMQLYLYRKLRRQGTVLQRISKTVRYLRWGDGMGHNKRLENTKKLVAEKITEALEDAIVKGDLSPTEASYWYKKIANICTIPDLLPRIRSEYGPKRQKTLKEILSVKWGKRKPVQQQTDTKVINMEEAKEKVLKRFKVA